MTSGTWTILYPVTDLEKAKAFYSGLAGMAPTFGSPYYVGFQIDGQDIGLVPNGQKPFRSGLSGPLAYWTVDDIKESLRGLVEAGAELQDDVRDVGGGKLVATVKDGDGNMIGLMQNPS